MTSLRFATSKGRLISIHWQVLGQALAQRGGTPRWPAGVCALTAALSAAAVLAVLAPGQWLATVALAGFGWGTITGLRARLRASATPSRSAAADSGAERRALVVDGGAFPGPRHHTVAQHRRSVQQLRAGDGGSFPRNLCRASTARPSARR